MSRSMEDLKTVIGENLVKLRRGAEMTQSQLAERLGYTDKAVSKWECGDAVPDIWVLTRISEEFGVKVDYLLERHEATEVAEAPKRMTVRRGIITALSALLVWVIATACFVVCALASDWAHAWLIFIYAIPVCALVVFILSCIWGHIIPHYVFLSFSLWGTILSVFLSFTFLRPIPSIWMVFLIGIPLQIIIFLWPALFHRLQRTVKRGKTKDDSESRA